MKREIQSIADRLSTPIRQAEKDLDLIKIQLKVRKSVRAGRVSGDVGVTDTQPLIFVFAALHKRETLSSQARAFNLWADIQVDETKSLESSPQVKIRICKHPGVGQAA